MELSDKKPVENEEEQSEGPFDDSEDEESTIVSEAATESVVTAPSVVVPAPAPTSAPVSAPVSAPAPAPASTSAPTSTSASASTSASSSMAATNEAEPSIHPFPNANANTNVSPVVIPKAPAPAPMVPPTYYSSPPPPQPQSSPSHSAMTNMTNMTNTMPNPIVSNANIMNTVIETPDRESDALVAGFTATRFFTAVSLISAAGNMYTTNPGPHYIIAGILLFTSKLMEFIGKCITPLPFGIGIVGSITMLISGVLSVDKNQVDIQMVGIMWIITGFLLFIGHTASLIQSYSTINYIISVSKLLASVGALFFAVGGVIMYSLDEVHEDNVHYFAEMFIYGGVFYLAHAITMGSGHQLVLKKVYAQMEYQATMQQQQQQYEAMQTSQRMMQMQQQQQTQQYQQPQYQATQPQQSSMMGSSTTPYAQFPNPAGMA